MYLFESLSDSCDRCLLYDTITLNLSILDIRCICLSLFLIHVIVACYMCFIFFIQSIPVQSDMFLDLSRILCMIVQIVSCCPLSRIIMIVLFNFSFANISVISWHGILHIFPAITYIQQQFSTGVWKTPPPPIHVYSLGMNTMYNIVIRPVSQHLRVIGRPY